MKSPKFVLYMHENLTNGAFSNNHMVNLSYLVITFQRKKKPTAS